MNGAWHRALPWLFVGVAALSRWPGLLPPNFSAFYALAFCAGAFFAGRLAWALPLGTLVLTDVAINLYYQFVRGVDCFTGPMLLAMAGNYVAFALLILLGRGFGRHAAFIRLLAGGLLGAVLFYLITNTLAWWINPFRNPEYTRTFAGWFIALTHGTAGHPPTWEFFRNTLLSSGLFTALFAGTLLRTAAPQDEDADEPASEAAEPDAPAEEAKG